MVNKRNWFRMVVIALAFGMAVIGCDNGTTDNSNNGNPNPFVGIWTKDASGGTVKVAITENTWTAKVNNVLYNAGTYTYSGTPAVIWEVTDKGVSAEIVGGTGNAAVSNSIMTVTSFSDNNMNGTYSKLSDFDGTWISTTVSPGQDDYVKIVAENGSFKQFISTTKDEGTWKEVVRGTYQKGAKSPVTVTNTEVNMRLFGSGDVWELWEDLEDTEKAQVPKSGVFIISDDTANASGILTFERQ